MSQTGEEIIKAPEQKEMLPTWKLLYEADWEQGFNTFMLILAQQYKIELMIQIGNKKQPSPVIEFWRERLKGMSPKQMIEGLHRWSGESSFQPTPENIRFCGEEIPADDKPRQKKNPDCEACGGTGWRAKDGRMYREWSGRDKLPMVKCDCTVVVYKDKIYTSAKFQLQAAPEDRKPQETKRIPEIPSAKTFPARKDLDLNPNSERVDRLKAAALEIEKKYTQKVTP